MIHGHAIPANGIEHRKFQLFVIGAQIDEQIVDFVEHLVRPGILAVDLVDDHHHGQAGIQRFLEHKAGLRQRPLGGIHQQDGAGGHGQGTLHFAAEIGVAGGVDNIDLHAFPVHGAVLGGNGDAAFAFQVHAVHDAVIHLLIGAEHPALTKEGVHQRGLAMVDVSNNGHIAKKSILFHKKPLIPVRKPTKRARMAWSASAAAA